MVFWKKKKKAVAPEVLPPAVKPRSAFFSTDFNVSRPLTNNELIQHVMDRAFPRTVKSLVRHGTAQGQTPAMAMDAMDVGIIGAFNDFQQTIPDAQLYWYAGQGFIGYQTCAIIAQHWLVDKACTMPAKDAVRTWFEIKINEGTNIPPEVLTFMRQRDKDMKLAETLVQFVRMSRVFGIRIALPVVEYDDPMALEKPFNIDGVKPGSYKGISQIDPYWITPLLDADAASNPASIHFYEPTWWVVNGRKIHRTHLVITRPNEVPDVMKPAYLYGGVSVPQKIYERVYAAERTANEAPLLAMTKRSTVIHTDIEQALANEPAFMEKLSWWVKMRDNKGVKVMGTDETMEQFDTSLSDLDAVIMTQYQVVAAAADVPATKLLGTTPKGFNATGEFEESSYHETLESLQTSDMTPLLDRHHALVIKSDVAQKFPDCPVFSTTVDWNPLDTPTAAEWADINLKKAQTAQSYQAAGAVDGTDIRQSLIDDPNSGYNNLSMETGSEEVDPLTDDIDLEAIVAAAKGNV